MRGALAKCESADMDRIVLSIVRILLQKKTEKVSARSPISGVRRPLLLAYSRTPDFLRELDNLINAFRGANYLEGCKSGLIGTPGKRVYRKLYREFESLPFRKPKLKIERSDGSRRALARVNFST